MCRAGRVAVARRFLATWVWEGSGLAGECGVNVAALNDMITNFGNGNPALTNLPRKINIGLSPSRDDFPHTHINDVGLVACKDPESGEVRPCTLPWLW